VEQYYVEVPDREKPDALVRVLKDERPDQAIVFVRTKIGVDRLARRLGDAGVRVKTLHGDMSQGQRDGVMIAFKGGRERLLIATDVAARGLDITGVSHVVNYDIPNSPDVYVHRIGRTGRVGRSGRAITFVEPRQKKELVAIEDHVGQSLSPWIAGAHVAPARIEERPRRHSKPHDAPRDGKRFATLIAAGGRNEGVEVADLVHEVTGATGLDGEAVRNVRVLERFSLLQVPADDVERITSALKERLEVEPARN
jgi:ATP-dependent RNA helicase DeaD